MTERERARRVRRERNRRRGRHDRFSNAWRHVCMVLQGPSEQEPNRPGMRYAYGLDVRVYHGETAETLSSPQASMLPQRMAVATMNPDPAFRVTVDTVQLRDVELLAGDGVPVELLGPGGVDIHGPRLFPGDVVRLKVSCHLDRRFL